MKIAVVGTRGVPATYGGIEKHCDEIYSNLINKGHEVTIYSRKGYVDDSIKEYKGIKIVPLWTFKSKHLETIFHTFWSLIHIMFSDADIIHFHAQGPCLFSWMPRIFTPRKKLVFTCHGLDWQRNKWNPLAKSMIYTGEIFSSIFFDTQITVSDALNEYYRNKYNVTPITITNGTSIAKKREANEIETRFGLNEKDYLMFVGRLVPEKAPHKLIEAFKQIETNKKLVLVGGSAATDEYEAYLKDLAKDDSRIIFTSFLYDEMLEEIYSNAYLYISASELEGLPLTLLEAMSYGIPSLVSPIPPHIEIIGKKENYGYLFKSEEIQDIKNRIQQILDKPSDELERMGNRARNKIMIDHNWQTIANKHEKVYKLTQNNEKTNFIKSALRRIAVK